ncbi:hypothetical protein AX15_002543 [Amanita polypyramis BW_CC]|nr:hypothetical protein AX15_002543 [Amanita polypyramis BW_CC]
MHDASRSSTSLVPMASRLTGPSFEALDHAVPFPRRRRRSTVSFVTAPPVFDPHRHSGHHQIRFKRKGALNAGITLTEAQSHIRLSNNDHYTLYDLNADNRATILLTVRWTGYPPMSYEIPLDSYDNRISLQTLARRVARACVHYFQSNVIPVTWDRVEIHHIEEISYGVWQPMLRVC